MQPLKKKKNALLLVVLAGWEEGSLIFTLHPVCNNLIHIVNCSSHTRDLYLQQWCCARELLGGGGLHNVA